MTGVESLMGALAGLCDSTRLPDARAQIENLEQNPTSLVEALNTLDQVRGDLQAIALSTGNLRIPADLLPNTAVVARLRRANDLPSLDDWFGNETSFAFWLKRAVASLKDSNTEVTGPTLREILSLPSVDGIVTAGVLRLYTEILYQRAWFGQDQRLPFFRALLELLAINLKEVEALDHLRNLYTKENGFSSFLVEAVKKRKIPSEAGPLLQFLEFSLRNDAGPLWGWKRFPGHPLQGEALQDQFY